MCTFRSIETRFEPVPHEYYKYNIQAGKTTVVLKKKNIAPLLILYVCHGQRNYQSIIVMFLYVFPSAKKWSVYHFNGRFILTARDKRKTWLSTWWQNPCWQSQRSDVSCSWPPGLHTSQEGICPTLCGSSPSLQYVWRRVVPKELDFGLIWPQHFHPVLLWIIGKLQTGLYMCFLEQGDLVGAAWFQSFTA